MASVYKKGGKGNRHGYYYAAWTDADGRRRTRCTKTTDRDAAQQFANKLESGAMLRREGIIDATTERFSIEGRRPVEELLGEFEAKMRTASRSDRHVVDTLRMIREAVAFAVAEHRDWLIATDEGRRTRRMIIEQLGAKRLLTTPAILLSCIRAGVLTVADADAIKAELERHRFRMAFGSFRELLPPQA